MKKGAGRRIRLVRGPQDGGAQDGRRARRELGNVPAARPEQAGRRPFQVEGGPRSWERAAALS